VCSCYAMRVGGCMYIKLKCWLLTSLLSLASYFLNWFPSLPLALWTPLDYCDAFCISVVENLTKLMVVSMIGKRIEWTLSYFKHIRRSVRNVPYSEVLLIRLLYFSYLRWKTIYGCQQLGSRISWCVHYVYMWSNTWVTGVLKVDWSVYMFFPYFAQMNFSKPKKNFYFYFMFPFRFCEYRSVNPHETILFHEA